MYTSNTLSHIFINSLLILVILSNSIPALEFPTSIEIQSPVYNERSIRLQPNFHMGKFTFSPGSYAYMYSNGTHYHGLDPLFLGVPLAFLFLGGGNDDENNKTVFGATLLLFIVCIMQSPNIKFTWPNITKTISFYTSVNYNLMFSGKKTRTPATINMGIQKNTNKMTFGGGLGVSSAENEYGNNYMIKLFLGLKLPESWNFRINEVK